MQRRTPLAVAACLTPLLLLAADAAKTIRVDIGETVAGKLPGHFVVAQTGDGGPPKWEVLQDSGGRYVLAQTSTDKTGGRYPLCVYDGVTAKDVTLSMWFKPVSGQVDQAGGIVVRYRDKDNYYITRANALEGNVRFYKVENGKRTQLASADVEVATRRWQTLELSAEGNHFEVRFGGKKLLVADDDTFPTPGRVGLWTKADSVTYFDELVITTPAGKEGP